MGNTLSSVNATIVTLSASPVPGRTDRGEESRQLTRRFFTPLRSVLNDI